MTLLDIDGTHNFRDTGGIALAAGGTTRPGVLYRSDALGALTPAGLRAFAATPIGVVVDFRSEAERTRMPDVLPEDRPIRTVLLPLLEGAMTGAPGATLPGGDASDEALAASPATAIEHALAWVDERGGSAAYLESAGVTGSDLERLRARIAG